MDSYMGIESRIKMLSDILHRDDCIFYCNSVTDDIHSYKKLKEIFWEIVYQHVMLPHKTQCLLQGLLYELLDCLIENFLLEELWDSVDMICIWMASDWVSNYFDARGIANGGNGLLTKDSVCKPAYYAMSFMNSLGKYCIKRGSNYIITSTEKKSYYVLCFNYKQYNYSYYTGDEDINEPGKIDDLFKDNDSVELDITLNEVETGNYVIKKRTVNPKEGNLLSEWKNFQYARDLDSKDVKYIRRACYPRMSMEHKVVKNNTIKFHVKLEAHEIVLFHIYEKNN